MRGWILSHGFQAKKMEFDSLALSPPPALPLYRGRDHVVLFSADAPRDIKFCRSCKEKLFFPKKCRCNKCPSMWSVMSPFGQAISRLQNQSIWKISKKNVPQKNGRSFGKPFFRANGRNLAPYWRCRYMQWALYGAFNHEPTKQSIPRPDFRSSRWFAKQSKVPELTARATRALFGLGAAIKTHGPWLVSQRRFPRPCFCGVVARQLFSLQPGCW